MAAPERLKQGRGSSPNLPAPWQNPWGLLWRDLGAVLASLGLGLRELWRRNGEGSLWRPAFWPQGGAKLFWPFLVVALVVLLVLGGRPLLAARRPPPLPPLAAGGNTTTEAETQAEKPPTSDGTSGAEASLSPPAATAAPVTPPSAPQPMESEAPAATPAPPSRGETEAGALGPSDAPLPTPDPLLQELAPDDPEGWIGATRAEPGASRLDLLLIDRFGTLPEPQRLALAGQWQRRAESLGYEDLRLLDGRGHLLARRALVGSGMILLEFPATPPEA
jgi:hypothetical protein